MQRNWINVWFKIVVWVSVRKKAATGNELLSSRGEGKKQHVAKKVKHQQDIFAVELF